MLMQSETAIDTEAPASWDSGVSELWPEPRWKIVDRALRTISARRTALDAEEARWLREADALQIWRQLGMVSALDYLERTLHYQLRTAQDRLRVARALGGLPQLTAALDSGELSFSAVRELTRVATPTTEFAWVATAMGKNVHEIEELVANHNPGDNPDDPPNPQVRTHVVRFELQAETFAALRQAHQALDDEHGRHLPDDAFIAALCGAVFDGATATEPTGRAKFQVAVTVCERCRQGWQEGAGANIPISPEAVERAMCDAQHIGSIDDAVPARAHQDIPPSVARLVWHRDHGRCRVPGCRSSRGLELHHIVHRADGGSHDPLNLILCCTLCRARHKEHYAGFRIMPDVATTSTAI
jgi:predicted nucleic acid-binding protein